MSLTFALILDAIFGEPKALWSRAPHPAVLMGNLVSWADNAFNEGHNRKLKGLAVVVGFSIFALMLGSLLAKFGLIIETVIAAVLFAQKSLIDHLRAVSEGLRRGGTHGRDAVSLIVSRDTSQMDQSAVARAAIESGAENLSDGLVAPVFWFALLGLPGLILYKLINTADSMIGYRTEEYREFGWAAARFDDLLNLIPARLTALLIAVLYQQWDQFPAIRADAIKHRSPNAGWPEAAMARVLGIALAGPRSYDGKTQDFAWVNGAARQDLFPQDIDDACTVLWRVWAALLLLSLPLALL